MTSSALAKVRSLVEGRPNDIEAWTALGDLYRGKERYAEAAGAYDKAIAAAGAPRPARWTLYYARGIALERSGRWDDAERDFQEALKLSPDQPQVLNYLGYSWVDQGKHLTEAVLMLEKAHALKPMDGYIADSVGWAYYRLGRYKEAAGALEEAVLLAPGDPTINDHLGDAYWRIGRRDDARFQWSHALSMNPDDKDKPAIQNKIQHGTRRRERFGTMTPKRGARAVTVCAPAKINLFLHVGDRRPDGYHALESLVVFTEAGDRIEASIADELTLEVTGPFAGAVSQGADNLVWTAARALDAKRGAYIALEKNLPVAAGVGGGSADAAATLRALNLLWQLNLTEAHLLTVAAELGSDVPACLLSRPLWMSGRGEVVRPAPALPPLKMILVNPGVPVCTKDVFDALGERSGPWRRRTPERPGTPYDVEAYLFDTQNDLQAPAVALAPDIAQALDLFDLRPRAGLPACRVRARHALACSTGATARCSPPKKSRHAIPAGGYASPASPRPISALRIGVRASASDEIACVEWPR